jgi:hypothetical protein
MRGLSLVGLLIGLGIVGVLVFNQTRPSPTGAPLPTEAIDKANEAVETMQQEQEALNELEQKIDQLEQGTDNLPE